jgi:hypothetical protein
LTNEKKHQFKNTNISKEFSDFLSRTKKKITTGTPSTVVPSSSSHTERVKSLVTSLKELPDAFPGAEAEVNSAILCFATMIENKIIAFTKESLSYSRHVIFGRTPVITILCDALEPVIVKLYPELSVGFFMLSKSGIWPFRDALMLMDKDLGEKAKRLKLQIDAYETIFTEDLNCDSRSKLGREIIKAGETMELLSATMSSINNCIPAESDINWCHFCFRRAVDNSDYCHLHHSGNDDTGYRRGQKVFNNLSNDTWAMMRRFRALRLLINDEASFIISDPIYSDIGSELGSSDPILNSYIVLGSHDQELIALTLKGNWSKVKSMWIKGIHEQFPLVAFSLRTIDFDCAKSWEDFVSLILKGIQEEKESVTHPYWVLRILIMAEAWLESEQKSGDKRLTNSRNRIYELADAGVKQAEIARTLGVKPSYVSRKLKERC